MPPSTRRSVAVGSTCSRWRSPASQTRVDDWLGGSAADVLADIPIEWVAPRGQPGLIAATFGTPNGVVRI